MRLARLAAFVLAAACGAAQAVPGFAEVKAAHLPSDLTLLDRHGVPLQTVRVDAAVRRLRWVPLDEMSPALLHAIVLSEDRSFHEHSGVDWPAVARSAWANVWNTRTRGASTLTMQLAGLIDDDLVRPAGGRSMAQKLGQALTARRLEARWTKSQILEAYLNSVPWRGEIVGIAALSQTLFGKLPGGLDAQEAALAAALVRGPNAGADVVARRACGVLQAQRLGCAGLGLRAQAALARRGGMPLGEQLAPHAARRLAGTAAPDQRALRSTLDARLQRFAVGALREQLSQLAGRHVEDGAVVVLDNRSGEVLAWVGGSGSLSQAPQVDHVTARRQPGSTIKPFVYQLAFEQRLITPATLLDDSPAQIGTASGLYLPQNYDHRFKGWISARAALAASINVPAVRVGAMLGADALFARLNAFGLALPETGGYYGASLALGSADVTLLALANAYRALANGGLAGPVRLRAGEPAIAPRRVADAAAAYLVTDILADNGARALTFGLDSVLATRGFAAVKTGTSKDMRDNWCLGFTDRYTVGVWVGNTGGEPMRDVSGISGAAPLWRQIVQHLHAGTPSRPPPPPPGVVRQRTAFERGGEPAREEVFIAGTGQRRGFSPATDPVRQPFGITSPRDGSVFALDPDMPAAVQRITFEGEPGEWRLDGRRLGHGGRLQWAPWPGRHVLTLHGGDGRVRQTVRFEVRGAAVREDAKAARQTPAH